MLRKRELFVMIIIVFMFVSLCVCNLVRLHIDVVCWYVIYNCCITCQMNLLSYYDIDDSR